MGKVLEMTLQPLSRLALGLCLCATLAGCASPLVKAAMARAAGPSAVSAVKPPKDSPQIYMTLVSRGIKFPMQLLDTQSSIKLWASTDGAQVALQRGHLGLGADGRQQYPQGIATQARGIEIHQVQPLRT